MPRNKSKWQEEQNRELELQIARQCAPLVAGLKMSNILITHKECIDKVFHIFKDTSVKVKLMSMLGEKAAIFLFKPEEIREHFNKQNVQEFMNCMGYKIMDTDQMLECFACRYNGYLEDRNEFPHEMGVLLGYPMEDVLGFMENGGRNCLYCGYWKVYSNLDKALDTFHRYSRAKEIITNNVVRGVTISQILSGNKTEVELQIA